jgi:alpha-L-rhamnosidase
MAVNIVGVTFEHRQKALGITQDRPRISWRFSGDLKDWAQEEYEIKIIRLNHEESVRLTSQESVLVPWPSSPLTLGESAIVVLRVFGGASTIESTPTPWSQPVTVEMGLRPED